VDKTIYKIRGNVFFKLGIYILVAVLAYGTLYTGGLVLQGSYLGVYSDDDQGATPYERLVNDYVEDTNDALTEKVKAYIQDTRSQLESITTYNQLVSADHNGDMVITADDVFRRLTNADTTSAIKSSYRYEDMSERGDIGYMLTASCSDDTNVSINNGKIKVTTGNIKLINDDARLDDNIYTNDYDSTIEVPVKRYIVFDKQSDMEQGEQYINALLGNYDPYYDEYIYNEEYEESDTVEADTDSVLTADGKSITKQDIMYGDYYPSSVEKLYLDEADDSGSSSGKVYCLVLSYDAYSFINITGKCYVDVAAAVDNIKASNPEMVQYIGRWRTKSKGILAGFAVMLLLCIVMSIFSMVNAGVKTGKETITLGRFERTPTELVLAMTVCSVAAAVGICVESGIASMCVNQYRNYTFVSENIQYIAFLVPVACLYSVALFFFNNIVAKVKAGTFFADCLIIRALKWIARKTKACFRYVKSHMSLTQKGVWAYIGITIVEIIFVAILAAGSMRGLLWVVIYIILKWLCIVGIVAYLIQTQELYKCAKEMAEGNLDRKADTSKMFWVFRAHGEHLNQIRDGMSKAVEARMKSEHLKTELITNVSHDIKTPLTSIINYVDLLQKDDMDEKTRQEYIEVLSRQSARLKKLIEDLVEASKASTGNIQINWAEIDANMLLEQAVAEYEDKLANAGLKVVFTRSELPAVIRADGQHLWRVFDNLLCNISKYAMPGTRVYASVIIDDRKTRIEFKNISRDPLNVSSDELMERFVRGDSSRNMEGSGLGLSIANSLCTLMGAKFRLSIDGDLFKAVITFDCGTPQKKTNC
jgi:signal transduction histidine kinase/tetrahydromethanopterin S-methyltransferase subunit G